MREKRGKWLVGLEGRGGYYSLWGPSWQRILKGSVNTASERLHLKPTPSRQGEDFFVTP